MIRRLNSLSSKLDNSWILQMFSLIFFYVLIVIIFKNRYEHVYGPSIFGDETSYLKHILNFHHKKMFEPSQYGPLYPFLAAMFGNFSDRISLFQSLLTFNFAIFSTGLFSTYFLLRKFSVNSIYSLLLAIALLFTGWNSTIIGIWAEPLYYSLSSLTWLLLLNLMDFKTAKSAIFLGFSVGLLFLTKMVGASILIVAIVSSLAIYMYTACKEERTIFFKLSSWLLGAFLLVVLPYIIYTKMQTQNALGYAPATNAAAKNIFVLLGVPEFYKNIFHQISYLIAGTFIFISLGIWRFTKNIKQNGTPLNFVFCVSVLMILGLSIVLSIFNNTLIQSYQVDNLPDFQIGRYMAVLLPSFFAVGINGLDLQSKNPLPLLKTLPVCGGFILLLGVCSPLNTLWSHGEFNAPDIQYLIRFIGQSMPPWSHSDAIENAKLYAWNIAAGSVLLSLLVFSLIRWSKLNKLGHWLVIFFCIFSGDHSSRFVLIMVDMNKNENMLYRKIISLKIPAEDIRVENFQKLNPFMAEFWLEEGYIFKLKNSSKATTYKYLITEKEISTRAENLLEAGRLKLYRLSSEAQDEM